MSIVSMCHQSKCEYADDGYFSEDASECSTAELSVESGTTTIDSAEGDTVSTGGAFIALDSASGALLYSGQGWVPCAPNPAVNYVAYKVTTYNLGMMYAKGVILNQDKAKACELYEKAAEEGHVKATFNLGLMYQRGEGVAKDSAKAAALLQRAHAKGYLKATRKLAMMYQRGEGVQTDYAKAAEYFHQSASLKIRD
jgi:hypothetical protein